MTLTLIPSAYLWSGFKFCSKVVSFHQAQCFPHMPFPLSSCTPFQALLFQGPASGASQTA